MSRTASMLAFARTPQVPAGVDDGVRVPSARFGTRSCSSAACHQGRDLPMTLRHAMLIALTAVALGACETPRPQAEGLSRPSTLYVNGRIVTMEGAQPDYVEALVVNDGRITFAGSRAQ